MVPKLTCLICNINQTIHLCHFTKNPICLNCKKDNYISFTQLKKEYIGVDYSNLRYMKDYISKYKKEIIYFFKRDIEDIFKQLIID